MTPVEPTEAFEGNPGGRTRISDPGGAIGVSFWEHTGQKFPLGSKVRLNHLTELTFLQLSTSTPQFIGGEVGPEDRIGEYLQQWGP